MLLRSSALVVLGGILATAGFGRLIPSWGYDELMAASDVVAVVEVTSIADTAETLEGHGDPNRFQSHHAKLKTLLVIKGDPTLNEVTLRYFSYSRGSEPNGALFLYFADHATTHYLVFLKRGPDGIYIPATGHYDAAIAVKRIQRS